MPVGTQDTRAAHPGRHRRTRNAAAPGRHGHRPSLAQVLLRATAVAACSTVGLVAGFGNVPAMSSGTAFFAGVFGGLDREGPTTPVERLIDEHDCWTGPAPGAVTPSRAVVSLPGRTAEVTDSEVGFELWLGPDREAGTGDERAGKLHAFCP